MARNIDGSIAGSNRSRKRARQDSPLNPNVSPPQHRGTADVNPSSGPNVPGPMLAALGAENNFHWIALMGSQIAQMHASSARKEAPFYSTWTYVSMASLMHVVVNRNTTLMTSLYPQHPVSITIDSLEDEEDELFIAAAAGPPPPTRHATNSPLDDPYENAPAIRSTTTFDIGARHSNEASGNEDGGEGGNVAIDRHDANDLPGDEEDPAQANISQTDHTSGAPDSVPQTARVKSIRSVRFDLPSPNVDLPSSVPPSPPSDPIRGFPSSPVQAAVARKEQRTHESPLAVFSLSSDPLNLFNVSSPSVAPSFPARQRSTPLPNRLFDDLPPSDAPLSPHAAGPVIAHDLGKGSSLEKGTLPEPPTGSQATKPSSRASEKSPTPVVLKPSRFESTRYPDFLKYLSLAKYDDSGATNFPKVQELLDERVCLIEEIKRPLDPSILANWAHHAKKAGPLGRVESYQVSLQARYVFEQDKRLKRLGVIIAFGHWFHYREYSRDATMSAKLYFDWADYILSDTPSGDSPTDPNRTKIQVKSGSTYLPKVPQLMEYFDQYGMLELGTEKGEAALTLIRHRIKIIHRSVFKRVDATLGTAYIALEDGESWDVDEDEDESEDEAMDGVQPAEGSYDDDLYLDVDELVIDNEGADRQTIT